MAGRFPLSGDEGGVEYMKSDIITHCRLHKDYWQSEHHSISYKEMGFPILYLARFDPRVLLDILQIQHFFAF